jgi:hypothetical protein
MVEHVHGKHAVIGSIPIVGSAEGPVLLCQAVMSDIGCSYLDVLNRSGERIARGQIVLPGDFVVYCYSCRVSQFEPDA